MVTAFKKVYLVAAFALFSLVSVAEVAIVDVEQAGIQQADNQMIADENFSVSAVQEPETTFAENQEQLTYRGDSEHADDNLPSQLPSKNIDVTADANTSVMLLGRIDDLVKELQFLHGQLEVQGHKIAALEKQLSKNAEVAVTTKAEIIEKAKTPLKFPKYFKSIKNATHKKSDSQSYLAAYEFVKQKQFSEAITALNTFVESYPGSPYLANAHYWLGELYLSKGATTEALTAFDTVITAFPTSNKVAGATLKKGFVFYEKRQWEAARQQLLAVQSKYPDTTLARLATSKLDEMKAKGL